MSTQDSGKGTYERFPWLHVVLWLLAGVSGSIDAIGYLRLGHVLTANMTGTTVLLGVAAGQGRFFSAVRSLAALLGFMAGVGAGTYLVNRRRRSWVGTLFFSLSIEGVLLFSMSALWLPFFGRNTDFVVFASILLCAVSMGMQSATIRHLQIPGVVTTFISGTITQVVSEAVVHFRGIVRAVSGDEKGLSGKLEKRMGLQFAIFLVYGCAAGLTSFIDLEGLGFLPLLPLVLILCALAVLKKHAAHFGALG